MLQNGTCVPDPELVHLPCDPPLPPLALRLPSPPSDPRSPEAGKWLLCGLCATGRWNYLGSVQALQVGSHFFGAKAGKGMRYAPADQGCLCFFNTRTESSSLSLFTFSPSLPPPRSTPVTSPFPPPFWIVHFNSCFAFWLVFCNSRSISHATVSSLGTVDNTANGTSTLTPTTTTTTTTEHEKRALS